MIRIDDAHGANLRALDAGEFLALLGADHDLQQVQLREEGQQRPHGAEVSAPAPAFRQLQAGQQRHDRHLRAPEHRLLAVGAAQGPDRADGAEHLEAEGRAPGRGPAQDAVLGHPGFEEGRQSELLRDDPVHQIQHEAERADPAAEETAEADGQKKDRQNARKRRQNDPPCGEDVLQGARRTGQAEAAGVEVAEGPEKNHDQKHKGKQLHRPTDPLDPSKRLSPGVGESRVRAVLHAERVPFAEVALADLGCAAVPKRRGLRACRGAEAAGGAEELIDADDAVLAPGDRPGRAGLDTEGFSAVLTVNGKVPPPDIVSDNAEARRGRGDFPGVSCRADRLAGSAAGAAVGIEEDKGPAAGPEAFPQGSLLGHPGPQVVDAERLFPYVVC